MKDNGFNIWKIDLPLVLCYLALIIIGWLNIYSSIYVEGDGSIFNFSQKYGMQLVWMSTAIVIAIGILFIFSSKIYSVFSPIFYFTACLLLISVIFLGKEINGSKSWFVIGPVSFQPAEVSKICTSLFIAYIMGKHGFKIHKIKDAITIALTILVPMMIIIMEKETGSALVYCGFVFVLYREGLSGWFLLYGLLIILLFIITLAVSPFYAIVTLFFFTAFAYIVINKKYNNIFKYIFIIGAILIFFPKIYNTKWLNFLQILKIEHWALILSGTFFLALLFKDIWKKKSHIKLIFLSYVCSIIFIFSVQFIFHKIMQPHQRSRIENLLGITEDLKGAGYNVHQSKIAIGSGGFTGKGFLNGTQTKYNFVPEQSTDFIFCTIGEEWGFIGGVTVIGLFLFLIIRIILLSEKQKDNFSRIYGYCVASCFFMHMFINIGMTMGILPVIGIPLPFISYGGSSLWSFTILLFIFIRLNMDRWEKYS
jgi:Bacterial cell division membrane protein